jgi:hypothetical protein
LERLVNLAMMTLPAGGVACGVMYWTLATPIRFPDGSARTRCSVDVGGKRKLGTLRCVSDSKP